MPATRNQLLARLHCLKKEHGWDDDAYRDILQARTGQRSAAALDGPALARAVADLGGQKSAPARRQPHEWDWVNREPNRTKRDLLWKIRRLCIGLGIAAGAQVAYAAGIALQMSGAAASAGPVVKPLPMCDADELKRIVQALTVAARRKGLNPNALDA